jgi:hypothetical protein
MYYIIYEITNKLNGKKYRGKHKTKILDDSYMGSGVWIKRSIEKNGIKNFEKTVLFMAFDDDSLNWAEKYFVDDEWVSLGANEVYNLKVGGQGGFRKNMVTIKGKQVTKEEFNKDNSLNGIAYGKLPVKDEFGRNLQVDKNDERVKSGELIPCFRANGTVTAIDKNGNKVRITKEEFSTGKYKSIYSGTIGVRDKFGNFFRVDKNDPRYLSGELVGNTRGRSFKTLKYKIFSENGELMFEVNDKNIKKFLIENNLPSILVDSFRKGGQPIYQKLGSNEKRIYDSGMIKYKGWYCIQEK